MASAEAIVRIKALDKISSTMEKIRKKFPKMTKSVTRTSRAFQILQKRTAKMRTSLKRMGGAMQSVGRSLTTGVTLPIVAFGGFAIKAAGDFEAAMKDVQGKTGATGKDLDALKESAKKMGIETQFSANQAAEAQTFLAQAGLNTKQILTALPNTLQLAAAANLDLAQAADLSTNVLLGYGMQVEELGRLNDVLVTASNKSNLNVVELSESMKIAGPIFSSQNVALEDTVSIMGNLANAGIKGSEAGVALRKAMSSLLKPTGSAKEAFKGLGIRKEDVLDSKGNVKDFVGVLKLLEKKGATATDLIKIFGERAGPKLIPLLKQGTKEIDKLAGTINGGAGDAAKIAALKMEGFNGAMKELKSAFEGLGIAIADSGILDMLTGMIKGIAGTFRWLSKLNPTILKWGAVLLGVIALIGPLLILFGGFLTALPFMISGWALFTAGMAGALPVIGAFTAGIWAALAPILIIIAKFALIAAGIALIGIAIKELIQFGVDVWFEGFGAAWDKLLGRITGGIKAAKRFFGFGGDEKIETEVNKNVNVQPQGKEAGAKRANQKAALTNSKFIEKTNNASVNVKFSNMPQGAKVISQSENGALKSVNTGMAGAF